MASSMLQVSAPLVFSNPGWGGYAFESFFCWYICTSRCVPLNHVQLQLQVWSNPHSVPSEAGPHFDNFAAARYSCCDISRKFTTVFGRSCPCLVAVFCINHFLHAAFLSFGQYVDQSNALWGVFNETLVRLRYYKTGSPTEPILD